MNEDLTEKSDLLKYLIYRYKNNKNFKIFN